MLIASVTSARTVSEAPFGFSQSICAGVSQILTGCVFLAGLSSLWAAGGFGFFIWITQLNHEPAKTRIVVPDRLRSWCRGQDVAHDGVHMLLEVLEAQEVEIGMDHLRSQQ
jgi:hypothetical protein